MKTPSKEGFYWGLWINGVGSDGFGPGNNWGCSDDAPPFEEWEVMHVVEEPHKGPSNPQFLHVMIPGVSEWQPLENFIWGDEVLAPKFGKILEFSRKT